MIVGCCLLAMLGSLEAEREGWPGGSWLLRWRCVLLPWALQRWWEPSQGKSCQGEGRRGQAEWKVMRSMSRDVKEGTRLADRGMQEGGDEELRPPERYTSSRVEEGC